MLAGNFALALSAIFIALGPGGLGLADLVLWLSAGAIVATRWLDVGRYEGTTADGARATWAHWRRHTVFVGAVAPLLWLVAHALAWLRMR